MIKQGTVRTQGRKKENERKKKRKERRMADSWAN
jgi:hypothetical protein